MIIQFKWVSFPHWFLTNKFNVSGFDLAATYELTIVEYYNENVNATNIENPKNVVLNYSSVNVTMNNFVLDVKAHSMIRIDVVGSSSTMDSTTTTGNPVSSGIKLISSVSIALLLLVFSFSV